MAKCFPSLLLKRILSCFIIALILPLAVHGQELVSIDIPKGTNLIHMAKAFCKDQAAWREISRINRLKPPYTIYYTKQLMIPRSFLATETVSGTVASVHGDVFWLENGQNNRKVQKGDPVNEGAAIRTGPDAFTQIIFPNHKYIRIAPDSEFSLIYLFKLRDGSILMDSKLNSGRVIHTIRRKLGVNEDYKARTPVCVTGVRGTEFRLKSGPAKAGPGKTDYIEIIQGRVEAQAAGRSVIIEKGQGLKVGKAGFTAPQPLPSPPAVPRFQDIYRTLPVVFTAPAHESAARIRLRLCTDAAGNDVIYARESAPAGKLIIPALADGTYHAFFTAINLNGFESLPNTPSLLKLRTKPSAPVISNPRNHHITFGDQVSMTWLASDLVVKYRGQLARDPEFKTIVAEEQLTQTRYWAKELTPGKYYFRVSGMADDGFETLFSVAVAFQILSQPAQISTAAAENGNEVFQWPPMAEVKTYDLQIGRDKEFEQIQVLRQGLDKSSYEVKDDLEAGTYYVRVRGVLADGQASQWTPAQTFIIEEESWAVGPLILGLAILAVILL
jgi:hypothetical protein